MRDEATVREHHERFVRRAVEHRAVWTVWGTAGPVIASSNESARDVYLWFSDAAYARRAYPEHATREVSLFDLLFRWLPGLARDGHLCGTNWTGELVGLEIEPDALQRELLDRLPAELLQQYRDQLAT